MKHLTKDFSDQALGFVISDLLKQNIQIALPINPERLSYSLISISEDNELKRCAIRYRSVQRGKLDLMFPEDKSVDALIIFCPETEQCYYVNRAETTGSVILRIDQDVKADKRSKNADDYQNPMRIFKGEPKIMYSFSKYFSIETVSKSSLSAYKNRGKYYVEAEDRSSLPVYEHQGKYYVEAQDNQEFRIRFMHPGSNGRMLFIATVDGKNIITGEPGSAEGQGYILKAGTQEAILGWRSSSTSVNKFMFTAITESKDNSYAGLTGSGENSGVIGCVVFKEKVKPPVQTVNYSNNTFGNYPPGMRGIPISCNYGEEPTPPTMGAQAARSENYSCDINMTNTSSSVSLDSLSLGDCSRGFGESTNEFKPFMGKPEPVIKMGTAFGESTYSPVAESTFDREDSPFLKFQIYYDSRENLIKRGIITLTPAVPSAFPADNKYCKSPY